MKDPELPPAFFDPEGRNLDEVRRFVGSVVELVLGHRATAARRAPLPDAFELPIAARVRETPASEEEVLAELRAILSASANTASPDYVGHMGAVSTVPSAVADFVSALVNNNLIGLELSPAFSLLEERLARELARFFGLPEGAGGSLATGGSLSNLHALAVARNARAGTAAGGVHGLPRAPVLLASAEAHASVRKAAMILGLGGDGAVPVAVTRESRMDPDDLVAQLRRVEDAGRAPFCVVATAGTTVTGNIDPLGEIGAVCRNRGLWFHVDAAWGGGLRFSERLAGRLAGIESADSITFCPQKLLLVALSSSLTLFRDWRAMERVFRVGFPYLEEGEAFVNRSEVGVQGSRPAEVLKLWLSLESVGTRTHGQLIERWVDLAEDVAARVGRRRDMELASPPESGIVCFRSVPPGIPRPDVDAWNASLQRRVLADSGVYLSLVRYRGAAWLRAVFANPFTDRAVVDLVFECLDRHVAAGG